MMLRFLAGVVSAVLLMTAGIFLFRSDASTDPATVAAPPAARMQAADDPIDAPLPAASAKTREQRRFDRYDKDRDARITRDEYLVSRRKAFAKLDRDGDGRLSFDEWAARTTAKFTGADRDRSGTLDAAEFATTAVRRSPTRARARDCPPPPPSEAE